MPAANRRAGALSRREALARLFAASFVLQVACRQNERPPQLRGLVVDVQSASFSQVQAFTLRTDSGETHEFVVEGNVGFTPSHLREHMLLGDPVIVSIRHADGLQIATLVEDANPQTPAPAP
jgi:hypothetical protein